MINYFFLLLLLIYPIFSKYQPLKKYNGFDKLNDKICKYKYADIEYVKMCKEGKYCKSIKDDLSMCVDIPKQIKKKVLGETCSSDEECEENLHCDNKCTLTCPNSQKIYKKADKKYGCKDNDMPDGLFYYEEFDNNFISKSGGIPKSYDKDYGKVGGIISYIKDNDNIYHITKKENAFIGTVKEGEYVDDPLACQSGYALPFFLDGTLTDPRKSSLPPSTHNDPYKKCVVVNEVGYDQNGACHVNYDDNKIYYDAPDCDESLMIRLKLFKKYTEKFTKEKQESCASDKENYNEPETCNDDETRKWRYFYDNFEYYILFYEKEDEVNDVVNYLIQDEYHAYQSSNFLKLKYLFLLLSLLLI
jgi:hypothetical protein